MKTNNSNALYLLPEKKQVNAVAHKPSRSDDAAILANARKGIREEARLLRGTARILQMVGLLGGLAVCAMNGHIMDLYETVMTTLYGGASSLSRMAVGLAVYALGLFFASLCLALADILLGVATNLSNESKKLSKKYSSGKQEV